MSGMKEEVELTREALVALGYGAPTARIRP